MTTKHPEALRKAPCCGYEWSLGGGDPKGPIFWNPFNNAVQCHNCGQTFSALPKPPDEAEVVRLTQGLRNLAARSSSTYHVEIFRSSAQTLEAQSATIAQLREETAAKGRLWVKFSKELAAAILRVDAAEERVERAEARLKLVEPTVKAALEFHCVRNVTGFNTPPMWAAANKISDAVKNMASDAAALPPESAPKGDGAPTMSSQEAPDALSLAERLEKALNRARFVNAYTCEELNALIEAASDASKALRQMAAPGWRPVDSAPPGTMVLFADMRATEAKDWCFVGWLAGTKIYTGPNQAGKATHWMPLPAAPEATAGETE